MVAEPLGRACRDQVGQSPVRAASRGESSHTREVILGDDAISHFVVIAPEARGRTVDDGKVPRALPGRAWRYGWQSLALRLPDKICAFNANIAR